MMCLSSAEPWFATSSSHGEDRPCCSAAMTHLVFLPYRTNDKGVRGTPYELCCESLTSIHACAVKQEVIFQRYECAIKQVVKHSKCQLNSKFNIRSRSRTFIFHTVSFHKHQHTIVPFRPPCPMSGKFSLCSMTGRAADGVPMTAQ